MRHTRSLLVIRDGRIQVDPRRFMERYSPSEAILRRVGSLTERSKPGRDATADQPSMPTVRSRSATRTRVRAINAIENAPTTDGPTLRIALELPDTDRAAAAADAVVQESGAEILAPPKETHFRTITPPVQGPAGWQIPLFQELETLEQRRSREGFVTDAGVPGRGSTRRHSCATRRSCAYATCPHRLSSAWESIA